MASKGISLQFGTHEDGLWFDSDDRGYNPNGFGLKLSFLWGLPVHIVINKFSKLLKSRWVPENNWKYWVWRKRTFGLFFSIAIGPYGFYVGLKPNKGVDPSCYILSASLRKSRWL